MTNNIEIKQPTNPSVAWYLLPIFFGILGGLGMYFVVRDDNKPMAKKG